MEFMKSLLNTSAPTGLSMIWFHVIHITWIPYFDIELYAILLPVYFYLACSGRWQVLHLMSISYPQYHLPQRSSTMCSMFSFWIKMNSKQGISSVNFYIFLKPTQNYIWLLSFDCKLLKGSLCIQNIIFLNSKAVSFKYFLNKYS